MGMARAHPSTALFAATSLGGCQETLGEQQPVFQVGVSASTYSQGILRSRKAGGHHHRVMFHVEHDRSPESLRTRLRRRLLVDEGLSGFYVSRSETSLRRRPASQRILLEGPFITYWFSMSLLTGLSKSPKSRR